MPDEVKVEARPITNPEGNQVFELWRTVTKETGESSVVRIGENVRPSDCTANIAECEAQIQTKQDEIATLQKSIKMWEDLKVQIAAIEK